MNDRNQEKNEQEKQKKESQKEKEEKMKEMRKDLSTFTYKGSFSFVPFLLNANFLMAIYTFS